MHRTTIGLVTCLVLASCEDPVTVESIPGTYVATILTVTEAGSTQDYLDAGASIVLTLNADGTTSGQLFVPGGAEGGGDFDADLAGTWTLDGSQLTLDHDADTFLRDMTFDATEDRLSGVENFGEATVRCVLERE